MRNQGLNNRREFEIITQAERLARDPRGLERVTLLSNGSAIVKKVITVQPVEREPIDPAGITDDLLEVVRERKENM